jgi:predicted PurR-regulated permease PerM
LSRDSFSSRLPPIQPVTQSELVRAALVVVATLVGLQLLWSARFLVLTAFLGLLFGLAASQAVDWIQTRVRIKRTVAAAMVVFGSVGLLLLIGLWSGPTLASQSQELRSKLPEAVTKVEAWLASNQPRVLDMLAPPDSGALRNAPIAADSAPGLGGAAAGVRTGRLVGAVSRQSASLTGFAFGVLQSTLAVAAATVLVIFLALYIASDPRLYRRGALLMVPIERRDRIDELLTALGGALRTWFATQLVAMFVIGAVTTIALALIGVRGALPLGVLAGIFEFIPNVGPILSAIPAILVGFADSPRMALTVVGLYWAIQFLENNLLIPYLMKEQLNLPPALTLVTQVVMAYVFGFLGLFVAIPLLATVVVAVRMLWVEDDLPPLPTVEFPAARASARAGPVPPEPRQESPL